MDSPRTPLFLLFILAAAARSAEAAGDGCSVGSGCDLALGSYYIQRGQNLTSIAGLFGISNLSTLQPYIPKDFSADFIRAGDRMNINFRCSCLSLPSAPGATYLAGSFPYKVATGDTYTTIAGNYHNLTTADWLQATNTYPTTNIPDTGTVNVTVNCSCGDRKVSKDYGLFLTFPLSGGYTLADVAANYSFSSPEQMDLLRKYNPGADNVTGTRLVYIPVKGSWVPVPNCWVI